MADAPSPSKRHRLDGNFEGQSMPGQQPGVQMGMGNGPMLPNGMGDMHSQSMAALGPGAAGQPKMELNGVLPEMSKGGGMLVTICR